MQQKVVVGVDYSVKLNMMRHARAFKRALNHLSHLHTFPTVWQMVQDVSRF